MATRPLAGVEHMVSTVEGTLRPRCRSRGAARGDVPRRVDHGRAEDRGGRPDRGARAGRSRARRWVRSAASTATATSSWRSRSGRSRSPTGASTSGSAAASSGTPIRQAEVEESWIKADPLLARSARRSERDGRRACGSARAVRRADEPPAARRRRLRARRSSTRRAGARRRRRGVHARPGRVRDDAGLRRPAVPARRSTSSGSRGSAERIGLSRRPTRRDRTSSPGSRSARRRRRTRRGAPALLDAGPAGRRADRASSLVGPIPDWIEAARARGQRLVSLAVPAPRRRLAPARHEVDELRRPTSPPRPRRRRAAPTTRCSSTPTGSCSRAR